MWAITARQHGVITWQQLIDLGYSMKAIRHRIASGRLHPITRGVYAVGRPQVGRHGLWMANVLSLGPAALLSHGSGAALLGIAGYERRVIEISVPAHIVRRRPGVIVRRRRNLSVEDRTTHHCIPVTDPAATLIDLAASLPRNELEAAINEADQLGLISPASLRAAAETRPDRPGSAALRKTLDIRTFVLTDSELERLLVPIARRAGLPKPATDRYVNGFKVDFFFSELGIVVEADGGRYHHTPSQRHRDTLRDQTHAKAGLIPLRFTHGQIAYHPSHVHDTLAAVAARRRPSA